MQTTQWVKYECSWCNFVSLGKSCFPLLLDLVYVLSCVLEIGYAVLSLKFSMCLLVLVHLDLHCFQCAC